MKNQYVIGVSSVAGAGKDTFYLIAKEELIKEGYEVRRYALADALKEELKEFCLLHYGIDPSNCSREDKEKIRDLLVFHGNYKRDSSLGSHWVKIVEAKIKSDLEKYNKIVFFITDVRYCKYESDELYYLKSQLNGILLHIRQYDKKTGNIRPAANKQEEYFDPILEEKADYNICWPKIIEGDINQGLRSYVRDFLKYFKII